MRSKLLSNFISLFVLQGGQYILPLITFPYLARVLEPEGFGIMGLSFAIMQYCMLFIDYGFNLTATKKIAENKDSKRKVSEVFWTTMASKSLLAILVFFFLVCTVYAVPSFKEISFIILLASTQLIGSILIPGWLFQGIERLWAVTISSLAARATAVPLIFIFVHNPEDLWLAVVIQAMTTNMAGIIACYMVYRYKAVCFKTISPNQVKEALKDGFPIFIASIAISLYTMSTTIVLGVVSSHEQVGLFNASDKIRNAITSAFLILGNAFFPRVNALLAESREKAGKFIKNIIFGQCFVTLTVSLALFFLADFLADFALGEQYSNAAHIIRIMAPMVFLVTTSVIFGNYMLLPFGYRKIYTQIPTIMAFIHLGIVFPMAYWLGAVGGAWTLLFTETLSFLALLFFCFRLELFKTVFGKHHE